MKVKFLTLNIFNSEFLDKCIDFLQNESPDIFVLQEVYDSQAESLDKKYHTLQQLKKQFKNFFYYYSPAFFRMINGHKVDSGNVIFSKFKIIEKETHFLYKKYSLRPAETVEQFSLTPRNLQKVVLKTGNLIFNVFNSQGIWGLDGKDNKYRLEMSRMIIEQIKEKGNVILAGDMNVQPDTKTINNIERYLTNVFKDELTTTFNMKQKAHNGFAKAVVDMVFISSNIQVVNHYCPQVDVSDHFPLVCILNIPE